jgi:hypothetical protein
MAINRYDQASRYASKLDATGLLAWLLRAESASLRFCGWLDTRTLPFPGDPERTCDTVAWLGDADPAVQWAIPLEFCIEPDGTLFGRLLVYLGQLWLEIRPTDAGGERFAVGAIVVNLTGRGQTSRTMRLRQTGMSVILQVVERNLADEDAAATLESIAAGGLSRCVLPWVPLMQRGDEDGIIQQWKTLAGLEENTKRRADYGGLALVFANAAKRLAVWKEALKEWSMIESEQVQEWINMGVAKGEAEGVAKGEAKGEANALLRLLAKRFPPGAPADLTAAIRADTNLERLRNWFDLALTADSLDAFRQTVTL